MGIFSDSTAAKAGDVNANLWTGLALLAGAAVFFGWARLRPIVVPQDVDGTRTGRPARLRGPLTQGSRADLSGTDAAATRSKRDPDSLMSTSVFGWWASPLDAAGF